MLSKYKTCREIVDDIMLTYEQKLYLLAKHAYETAFVNDYTTDIEYAWSWLDKYKEKTHDICICSLNLVLRNYVYRIPEE